MDDRKKQAIDELSKGKSISSVARLLDINKGYLSAMWEGYRLAQSEKSENRSNYSYVVLGIMFVLGAIAQAIVVASLFLLKKSGML